MMIYIKILIAIVCFALGLFFILYPQKAIHFQTTFYRNINWRLEPISMDREVRNTRIMGLLILICGVAAFYLF